MLLQPTLLLACDVGQTEHGQTEGHLSNLTSGQYLYQTIRDNVGKSKGKGIWERGPVSGKAES